MSSGIENSLTHFQAETMNNVITFHKKNPDSITVNGERIGDAEIDEAAAQFANASKPREAAARSLVIRTLLRQRAVQLQIEADDEEAAIEKLIEREVTLQPVFEEEIRRYFEGNRQKFRSGDLFEVRHILFDTTDAANSKAVLQKAEAALLHVKNSPASFEAVAKAESACSSAGIGGALGQLSQGAVVPEFWAALVSFAQTGILPHLVETRFGHHIVFVDRCAMGEALPFEAVQSRIRDYLTGRLEQVTYQQYIALLIEQAEITGIDLGDQGAQPAGPGLPAE